MLLLMMLLAGSTNTITKMTTSTTTFRYDIRGFHPEMYRQGEPTTTMESENNGQVALILFHENGMVVQQYSTE
jgi:hypothetical protein